MRIGLNCNLEQTQKLVMTPELRQAIVILQLSTIELTEYIQQALLENPLLEVAEENEEQDDRTAKAVEIQTKQEQVNEVDWREYFQDWSDLGYIRTPWEDKEDYSYENFLSQAPTLHDHLHLQLTLSAATAAQQGIGKFLIGNINDHGYFQGTVEEAASYFGLPAAEVEKVLLLIQSFDPPGVGARNLVECLLIQLRHQEPVHPKELEIITLYLKDLAAGRVAKIAKALSIHIQEVQLVMDHIRTLDPKPGRRFGNANEVRYIVPDVVVEKVSGEYIVLINEGGTPRLGINRVYQTLLRQEGICDAETRQFIEGRLNAATWVIRSIEQRRLTLYRVSQSIVDFQKDFLDKGIKYLHPLTLRQVAEVLGIHESTVSRATSNKYMQTPQGVYPLKFFFASGVSSAGTLTSTESIKKIMQEYVNQEDLKHPLTDQEIAMFLQRQGIPLARRTVAKYRDELNIPPAYRRKRY